MTKPIPRTAFKLISSGELTFDERLVVHRAVDLPHPGWLAIFKWLVLQDAFDMFGPKKSSLVSASREKVELLR